VFLALSLVPGPRLACLQRPEHRPLQAALCADALFWAAALAVTAMLRAWAGSAAPWWAGVGAALFLAGFLIYALRQPFQPPALPAGPQAPLRQSLRRVDLWFDALIVFPACLLAMTDSPGGAALFALGALLAGLLAYGLAAHPAAARRPALWTGFRLVTLLVGLIALGLIGWRLTLFPPI
jgi:hypothetical protein